MKMKKKIANATSTKHMRGKKRALENYKPVAERKFISFYFSTVLSSSSSAASATAVALPTSDPNKPKSKSYFSIFLANFKG